jgi:kynurenine formamidase
MKGGTTMYRTNKRNLLISLTIALSICLVLIVTGPTYAAKWELIDLTHQWENGMPVWMGTFDGISLSAGKTRDQNYEIFDGWWLYNASFTEHTGTHIDAPAHRKEGLYKLDDLDRRQLFGKVIVMDMRAWVRDRDSYAVTMDDVRDWERKMGVKLSNVARNGFVYFWTGWDKYWYEYFKGNKKFQVPNFPGISGEVGQYLAKSGVWAVGLDTMSLDPGDSKDFPAHIAVLSRGMFIIENLNNLAPIADKAVFVIHAPLKMKGGSGAPSRVWAIYDPKVKGIKEQLKWAEQLDARFRAAQMWDLTNYIQNEMHIWQGVFGGEYAPTGITTWINYDTSGGFWGQKCRLNEHTSTHIDSGSHRIEGKQWTITDHPVSQFYGPAVVIDASSYGPEDGDWILSEGNLKDWQKKHPAIGKLNKGDLPIFYLGWVDEWAKHIKGYEREKETFHFPGIGPDLAQYLVDVGVDGVGTDVTSIDAAMTAIYGKGRNAAENSPTHVILCSNGIWNCENMGYQLALASNSRGYVFFMTMPYIKGGSGGSTRTFYFEGLELPELED